MKALAPVYSFTDYKAYLRARLEGEESSWGLLTKWATAAGCQRPYLSRVLSQEAHLTPAQGYGLARYWRLGEDETEYFLGLLELDRAGSAEYRQHWKRKNEELRRKQENLARLVERETAVSDDRDVAYFSAWYYTAAHVLTSIPDFQSERAIAEKLGLPPLQARAILESLAGWGAVKKEGARWRFQAREQHLPKESPLVLFHHANWRQKALLDAQLRNPESLHYTVVQSLSRADYEKVRRLVIELIEKASKIAGPSNEEKMMCLLCDFFEP